MFCKNCGTQNQDGARFCAGCGADLTPAPAQPVYQAPVQQAPAQQAPQLNLNPKTITTIIVALITVLALVFGILNTFGLYEVEVRTENVTKSEGEKNTEKGKFDTDLADYYESLEDWDETLDYYEEIDAKVVGGPVWTLIANLVFGIVNLLIAVIGVLYLLKMYMGMPYYDMILGKTTKGQAPTKLMALVGAAASLIQMLILWIFPLKVETESEWGSSTTTSAVQVNAMTWIMLILCVLIIVVDFMKNNKNKMPRPAATYPQQ